MARPRTPQRKFCTSMGEFCAPIRYCKVMWNPKAQKNTIRVSGVLRMSVTYAVPKDLKTATGETRMIAMIVPMSRAPIAAATVSLMVIQNAANTLYSARRSDRPPSIQHTSWAIGADSVAAPITLNDALGRGAGVRLRWIRRGVDLEA